MRRCSRLTRFCSTYCADAQIKRATTPTATYQMINQSALLRQRKYQEIFATQPTGTLNECLSSAMRSASQTLSKHTLYIHAAAQILFLCTRTSCMEQLAWHRRGPRPATIQCFALCALLRFALPSPFNWEPNNLCRSTGSPYTNRTNQTRPTKTGQPGRPTHDQLLLLSTYRTKKLRSLHY